MNRVSHTIASFGSKKQNKNTHTTYTRARTTITLTTRIVQSFIADTKSRTFYKIKLSRPFGIAREQRPVFTRRRRARAQWRRGFTYSR